MPTMPTEIMTPLIAAEEGAGSSAGVVMRFKPTDPKYAKDPTNYLPNKTSLWTHPLESDGFFLEHCNIRSECTTMAKVLSTLDQGAPRDKKALAEWEIASLRAWFASHNTHIQEHHMHEDGIFTPFMQTRIKLPEELTTDHVQLLSLRKEIMTILEGPPFYARTLLEAFEKYQKMLFAHLKQEEEIGLPLLRAYFTPEEVAPKKQEILNQIAPHVLGGVCYHLDAEGGSEGAAEQFMAQQGIPFFDALSYYYFAFSMRQTYYDATQVHIDALLAGTPPPPPKKDCDYV